MFLNIFEKVIQMHGLQICRFHCNPMHTLLGNNSKEEKIYKITGSLFHSEKHRNMEVSQYHLMSF